MPTCGKCEHNNLIRPKVVHDGRYYRTSDSKWIQRYRCKSCKGSFSSATFDLFYRHRARRKHKLLRGLLCSSVSQRRAGELLRLDKKTVVRKFRILAIEAELNLRAHNLSRPKATVVEFDDLESFEHTKCKPLSVTIAVESSTRRILGLSVSSMPAKGLLVEKAKKYGPRRDKRRAGRRYLFKKIQGLIGEKGLLKSDSNPHYSADVSEFFPKATYKQFLGKRGSLGGQGELKKVRFDPLFSLNHTCAKLRADINRLVRRTWCTTKKKEYLYAHLILYADYHNRKLTPPLS